MPRTLIWFSTGAASFAAAKIILAETRNAELVMCETNNEDPDNYRFEADVVRHLNQPVVKLKSSKYDSVRDVWRTRRYIAGIHGATCTGEMKVAPRLEYQRPDDIHVFGYTNDKEDITRFNNLKSNYFEMNVRAPLIEAGIDKSAALAVVERAGLVLPRTYAMGFPNANCMKTGCGKASSARYWALYRLHFPENFAETAAFSREIGARLTRINGERCFIDEIPPDHPTTKPIIPACDFMCGAAGV